MQVRAQGLALASNNWNLTPIPPPIPPTQNHQRRIDARSVAADFLAEDLLHLLVVECLAQRAGAGLRKLLAQLVNVVPQMFLLGTIHVDWPFPEAG